MPLYFVSKINSYSNKLYNKVLYMRGEGLHSVNNLVQSSDELREMTKTIMESFRE